MTQQEFIPPAKPIIGEEERKIRRDPVGTGSAILRQVFGAIR